MKEVSCKAFESLDRALRDGRMRADELLEGVPYTLQFLRNKHERIEWTVWCQLIRNSRAFLSPADFEELGAAFASSPAFRAGMIVGRLLFRPARFLQWGQSMEREGHEMFTCVRSESRAPALDRFTLTLSIDDGYEDCPEFFYITKGTLGALPPLLGSPDSNMSCTIVDRQATYDLYIPPREGLLRRVRRVISTPFRTAAAARALQEAHQVLQLRYSQLDAAQQTLDDQARHLRAAHALNEVLLVSVDLTGTLQSIIEALCAVLDLEGAEIVVEHDPEDLSERFAFGTRNAEVPLVRELVARHVVIGKLSLWPAAQKERDELVPTLDFVFPNINIAIENALNYDALNRYRDELEVRVAERTGELQSARDRLAVSLEELEVAQSARERIFANINHEIRTPLSVVFLACAEARQANPAHPDLVEERIADIEGAMGRLLHLVDDLLLLAASDENKLGMSVESVDLFALVRSEVRAWEPLARQGAIALVFADQDSSLQIALDSRAIARALGNLISNAIKFTPRGGTIEVLLREVEGFFVISVRDTGVGMSEEFAARAFERFTQGPEPVGGTGRGSGIGLSIVREILEAHGGSADVVASEGEGSCFSLCLPVALTNGLHEVGLTEKIRTHYDRGAGPTSQAAEGLCDPSADSEVSYAHCVLVVDDEPELRRLMIRSLSPYYRVLSAKDGVEALAVAEESCPDLLVADISMPKMDGIELTRRFSEIPSNRAARVLLVTADAALGSRLDGFEAGAVDYITKPFHVQELLARVRAQLSIRDVLLQLHEVEKMAALGFLGAGLAHEIRNPMNVVANALSPLRQLLSKEPFKVGSKADALLSAIEDAAARMKEISKSMGQLENSAEMVVESVALRRLMTGAIGSIPQLSSDHVVVECEPGVRVDCAPVLLQQVFANILENAVHAAGREGVVEILASQEEDQTVVQISNDGPPIARNLREQVFQPFFTTKEPGQGTGLGLAISRHTVQRHGGTLRILDTSEGCAFEVRIPRSRDRWQA